MGDEPSEIDCSLFGMLSLLLVSMQGTRYEAFTKRKYTVKIICRVVMQWPDVRDITCNSVLQSTTLTCWPTSRGWSQPIGRTGTLSSLLAKASKTITEKCISLKMSLKNDFVHLTIVRVITGARTARRRSVIWYTFNGYFYELKVNFHVEICLCLLKNITYFLFFS